MKRILAFVLTAVMVVGILASCGAKDLNGIGQPSEQHSENETHGKIEAPDKKETGNKLDKNPDKETDDKGQNGGNSDNNENERPTPPQNENSSEGLEFSLDKSKKSYTLVGIGSCTESDIVINKYNGLPVSTIAAEAFYGAVSVKSITIGDSVTSIKESAFEKCLSLNDVKIGSSVLNIESNAFKDCSSIKNIEIPDSVKFIGENAFLNCKGAKNISVPYDAIIGDGAFDGCKPEELKCNLSVFNQNLTENIKSLTIGGIETVSQGAFEEVKDTIEKITFDEGLKTIESLAFKNCRSLTSVTIPNSVTSIGNGLFSGCYIKSATIPALAISYIPKSDLKEVVITTGNIRSYAFNDCSSLTSVTIGDGVTSIGERAFYGCSKLTSITIPDSVTSIGAEAFEYCYSLTSVIIPDSVTSIGYKAFYGCRSLKYNEYNNGKYLGNSKNPYIILVGVIDRSATSFTIHNTTKLIYSYAFEKCSSLMSITIPDSVTSIGSYAFSGCDSLKYNEYNNGKYLGNSKNPYVILVGVIDTSAKSFTIHNTTKLIYRYAFSDCSSLTSVTIPDSVTSIGAEAFWGCSSLASVTIPDSVTSIGNYAFYGCGRLASVTIPDSVTSIGNSAFESCSKLTSIKYRGTEEQWNAISKGSDWKYKVPSSCVITYNYTGK